MKYEEKTKSLDAEMELRIEKVFNMLIDSWSRYSILQFCKKEWDIERAMADNYIKKAKEKIVEEAKASVEDFHNESKARFRKLYRQAIKDKNFEEARHIIETMNDVLGYAKVKVVNINTDVTSLPEERRNEILRQVGLLKD